MWRFWRRPRALWPQAWLLMFVLKLIWRLALKLSGISVEEINKQVIPKRGPVILASNHLSLADPPLEMGGTPLFRTPVAMAMAELWDFKIWRFRALRWLLWLLGQIPVDRGNVESGKAAIKSGIRVLEHNGLLLIYPEGGCSRDGTLRKFKPGVAELAFAVPNAVVIPVHISGSNQLLPLGKGAKPDFSAHIRRAYGEPLSSCSYANTREGKQQFLKELTARMEALAPQSDNPHNDPEDAAPAA